MCVQFQHGEAAAQLTAMGFSEAEVRAAVSSRFFCLSTVCAAVSTWDSPV